MAAPVGGGHSCPSAVDFDLDFDLGFDLDFGPAQPRPVWSRILFPRPTWESAPDRQFRRIPPARTPRLQAAATVSLPSISPLTLPSSLYFRLSQVKKPPHSAADIRQN